MLHLNATDLPCPVCKAPIGIDPVALLRGEKAACGDCGTALVLEPGDAMRSTMEGFTAACDALRNAAGRGTPGS